MSVHGDMTPERIEALRHRLAADADVLAALDALEEDRRELTRLRGTGHTCVVLGPCAGGCWGRR